MSRVLFAAAACVVVSAPVAAGIPCGSLFNTVSWQYPSSGTFESNLNWLPASPPGPGDTACFAQDFGTTECTFTFDAACDAWVVDADFGSTVTVRSGLFRRELTVESMEATTFNELRVNDLDIDVTNLFAFGTVRVQNGSSISNNRVRVDSGGFLRVEGLGTSLVGVVEFDPAVDVASSSNGLGTLEVADSASITTMNLSLAPGLVSTGSSTAELLIETGGTVTADNVRVATGSGDRDATVLLRNPGSRLEATSELAIGSFAGTGLAIVNMQSGAELDLAPTSEIWPNGRLDMTDATLVVDETLDVKGGTFVAANDSTILLSPGVALAVRDGGTIDWARSVTANSPDVNEPISLQVESGALFEVTFTCTLGGTAGTRGEATVTGARVPEFGTVVPSTLRGTSGGGGADLRVGTAGQGALDILDGGFVQFRDDGIIGFEAGADGAVTVSGDFGATRSTLDLTIAGNAALLSVGENGNGSLDINFGGLVTTGGDAYFGRGLTGVADVIITGGIGNPATLLVGDDVIAGTNDAGATGSARIYVAGPESLLDANDTISLRNTATLELGTGGVVPTGGVVRTGFFSNSGTVEGTGQLDVGSITNGGLIAPSSDGAIEITGDLTLASTGELEIEVDPLIGIHGTVDVGGDLFLGGTLRITTPADTPVPDGRVLEVVTFGGTVTGAAFDSVIVPAGSVTPVVDVVGQTVRVTFRDPCVEDINGDGQVGFSDLVEVLNAWGPCAGACPADLNADGVVGFSDLVLVLNAWGPC